MVFTAALSVKDLLALFGEGEWKAERLHPARRQTQVPSHVLPPPCTAPSAVGLAPGASSDSAVPSPHPDGWPTGAGQSGAPGSETTKKARAGNL